jgi:hypothetical protein
MNDGTVKRAVRHGARTRPIEHKPRPKVIRGDVALPRDELALAMEMARADRIKQDIRDYAHRKRLTA